MLRKTIVDRLSVQTDLKRVMSKILDQRMLSKKETTHLILLLPMVSCSHMLARIDLDDNQHLINMQNAFNENSNVASGNTNHGNNTVGGQRLQKMRTPI